MFASSLRVCCLSVHSVQCMHKRLCLLLWTIDPVCSAAQSRAHILTRLVCVDYMHLHCDFDVFFFFLHKSLFCFQLCVEADTIDVDKLCLWIRACIPNTSNFVRLTFVCILCAQLSLATGHKSIWQKEQKHTQAMISCEPCTCSSLLRTFSYAVFVWCVPIAHKHKVGWVYKFICFLSWPFFLLLRSANRTYKC